MAQATLQDLAAIKAGGYAVHSEGPRMGWTLTEIDDPSGYLMIGSHGCVAPTKWEAVAEALARIEA